jgi:hypothetical protein
MNYKRTMYISNPPQSPFIKGGSLKQFFIAVGRFRDGITSARNQLNSPLCKRGVGGDLKRHNEDEL